MEVDARRPELSRKAVHERSFVHGRKKGGRGGQKGEDRRAVESSASFPKRVRENEVGNHPGKKKGEEAAGSFEGERGEGRRRLGQRKSREKGRKREEDVHTLYADVGNQFVVPPVLVHPRLEVDQMPVVEKYSKITKSDSKRRNEVLDHISNWCVFEL